MLYIQISNVDPFFNHISRRYGTESDSFLINNKLRIPHSFPNDEELKPRWHLFCITQTFGRNCRGALLGDTAPSPLPLPLLLLNRMKTDVTNFYCCYTNLFLTGNFRDLELYLYVFPPRLRHPTFAAIGFFETIGSHGPVMEVQARWACRVFKGLCKLPSQNTMLSDVRQTKQHLLKLFGKDKIFVSLTNILRNV